MRALAKLVQVHAAAAAPPGRRPAGATPCPALHGGGPTVDASALTVIAQACRDDERLRFDYTARDGEPGGRLVEPHRLVSLGRRWYLVAWDVDRGDWRTFRVDRLTDPVATGARFRPRDLPAGDAAAFVRGPAGRRCRAGTRSRSCFTHRRGDGRAGAGRRATVEPTRRRVCRLRMNVDDLDWPAAVLGMVGADFEVVEPAELRERVHEIGRLFARASGDRAWAAWSDRAMAASAARPADSSTVNSPAGHR